MLRSYRFRQLNEGESGFQNLNMMQYNLNTLFYIIHIINSNCLKIYFLKYLHSMMFKLPREKTMNFYYISTKKYLSLI